MSAGIIIIVVIIVTLTIIKGTNTLTSYLSHWYVGSLLFAAKPNTK